MLFLHTAVDSVPSFTGEKNLSSYKNIVLIISFVLILYTVIAVQLLFLGFSANQIFITLVSVLSIDIIIVIIHYYRQKEITETSEEKPKEEKEKESEPEPKQEPASEPEEPEDSDETFELKHIINEIENGVWSGNKTKISDNVFNELGNIVSEKILEPIHDASVQFSKIVTTLTTVPEETNVEETEVSPGTVTELPEELPVETEVVTGVTEVSGVTEEVSEVTGTFPLPTLTIFLDENKE